MKIEEITKGIFSDEEDREKRVISRIFLRVVKDAKSPRVAVAATVAALMGSCDIAGIDEDEAIKLLREVWAACGGERK